MLVTKRLEIEVPHLILLTVLRAVRRMPHGGITVMTLNGKSRCN